MNQSKFPSLKLGRKLSKLVEEHDDDLLDYESLLFTMLGAILIDKDIWMYEECMKTLNDIRVEQQRAGKTGGYNFNLKKE